MNNDYEYSQALERIFSNEFISKDFKTLLSQLNDKDLSTSYSLITNYENNLYKNQYIDILHKEYLSYMNDLLLKLYNEILEFIFYIVDNNGEIEFKDIKLSYAITLKMFFIAFPVIKDKKYKLVMSNEVLNFLKNIDRDDLFDNVETNDTIIEYNRNLLQLYGKYEVSLLLKYLDEYEGIKFNKEDISFLLNVDGLFYGYDIFDYTLYNNELINIENFEELRKLYNTLEYYHFSKKEILEVSILIKNKINTVKNFFAFNLKLPIEISNKAGEIIINAIKFELPTLDILNIFRKLNFPNHKKKELEKLINNIKSDTRLWTLKGHTPLEVSNIKN